MRSRIVALIAVVLASFSTLSIAQQPAQAAPTGDPAPLVAEALALLGSWKGEIAILEQARKKLEAAWTMNPKNPDTRAAFDRFLVVQKEMYAIQRKTHGGPAVAEARKILDSWPGQPDALVRAKAALDKVVEGDKYNAYVPIEMARLQMYEGYLNSRPAIKRRVVYSIGNYAPGTLQKAARTVQDSTRFDPLNGDVHIMQAHIFLEQDGPNSLLAAEESLKMAQAKGVTDARLHMAAADILARRGDYAAAAERVERALKEEPDREGIMLAAQSRLADIYKRSEQPEKAVAAYEALIKLDPQDAWTHGNYSVYLSESLGRYDQAIAEARKALQLMNYGVGRRHLARALYGKWAAQLAERKPDAEGYFREAQKLWPDLDEVMLCCVPHPAGERLAKALLSKGVSIDTHAGDGATALLIATNTLRNGAVKFLLALKANPNVVDRGGWTPFLSAASDANGEAVDLLVAAGADTKATLNGKDAATLAEQGGYPEYAATLRKRFGK